MPVTAAITFDFTILQRIHNCPRADGIKKKTCPLQQQLSLTSQSPNEFTIAQERMVLKKDLPATAAIILDFTKPQRVHNCPRADGIKRKLALYSSNYPRLHNHPTNSQMPKSGASWSLLEPAGASWSLQELPGASWSLSGASWRPQAHSARYKYIYILFFKENL